MKDRGLALVYQDTLLLAAPLKRWIALVYLGDAVWPQEC